MNCPLGFTGQYLVILTFLAIAILLSCLIGLARIIRSIVKRVEPTYMKDVEVFLCIICTITSIIMFISTIALVCNTVPILQEIDGVTKSSQKSK